MLILLVIYALSLCFFINSIKTVYAKDTSKFLIILPTQPEFQEEFAAKELAKYAKLLTGFELAVISDSEINNVEKRNVYFLISSSEKNKLTAALKAKGKFKLEEKLPAHREGFIISSEETSGAKAVLFAGRTPIATLYAVYEYLETNCGVGFFQDGEFIPKLAALPVDNIANIQHPRFDNRLHFCWNAHRGIKKYQSFWWTLDDWKREFEWMAKRKMNVCRIDMQYYSRFAGDAFQQAYPEIGPEPNDRIYPKLAGWSCDWCWPPEYRRKLTQEFMKYGRSLGIRFLYTMDYATIPFRFKDVHPEYKYMPPNQYGDSRQIAPEDPHAYEVEKKYLSKVIELFGTDHLYLYSPYCEIDVGGGNPEKNLDMRIEASKGVMKLIRDADPQGTWVTDTWDFIDKRRWNPERVKKYLNSFSNEGIYLYDTGADVNTPSMYKSFDWFHGKKWAFGVINALAGEDSLRGDPAELIERIKEAADCPTCTGIFMVPELTHSNVMFWDLVTHLAWQPSGIKFDEYLKDYIQRRYGRDNVAPTLKAWKNIVDAVYKYRPYNGEDYIIGRMYRHYPWYHWTGKSIGNYESCPLFSEDEVIFAQQMSELAVEIPLLKQALEIMLKQKDSMKANHLFIEDIIVIFRTYAAKCFNYEAGNAYYALKDGDKESFEVHRVKAMAILDKIKDVLSVCPSYSINKTIAEACSVEGHNPILPELIRQNCINWDYTTNDVYEQFDGQYIPKMKAYFVLLEEKLSKGENTVSYGEVAPKFVPIDENYRMNGWSAPLKTGDPIVLAATHFDEILKETNIVKEKTKLIQQTKDCSDFDVVLAGDASPSFRIVFPEHLQGEGTKRLSGTHLIPGKWETRGEVKSGVFKVENAFEISVEIIPSDTEIEASMKLKNLMDHEIKDLYVEVCVSPGHLPGNPSWTNRKFLPESPIDRDLQGQEWYGKVAPKKLRALTSKGWILMHPTPDDPDPSKVPQYNFVPSKKAEAFACAVQSADGNYFFYQAWNTNCLHVTPSRGNACMHLLPFVTKSLPPGKEAGVKALIGIHKGTWESLTEKITMFRKKTVEK